MRIYRVVPALLVASTLNALACTCIDRSGTTVENICNAKHVFLAETVMEVGDFSRALKSPHNFEHGLDVQVRVLHLFKGNLIGEVMLKNRRRNLNSSACGFSWADDAVFLVYSRDDSLSFSLCDMPQTIDREAISNVTAVLERIAGQIRNGEIQCPSTKR